MSSNRKKIVIGLLIIVLAVAYLIYTNFQASFLYYFTVSEVTEKAGELQGKRMRMAGKVEQGTLFQDAETKKYKFSLKEGDCSIAVAYQGILPDTFREGAEAVVEGVLVGPENFEADLVFAKCPSKYESQLQKEADEKREFGGTVQK